MTGIFDNKAIMYISKKVASVSSDIRRTLSICRQTIDAYKLNIEELKRQKAEDQIKPQIGIKFVAETFKRAYQSPINDYVKTAGKSTIMFLTCVYMQMMSKQTRVATYDSIFYRFSTMTQVFGDAYNYTYAEMCMILDRLAVVGILDKRTNPKLRKNEILLNVNIDDLAFSLKDEEVFIRLAKNMEKEAERNQKMG